MHSYLFYDDETNRVFYWFRDVSPVSELISVKDYAVYVMILTGFECLTWLFGICVLGQDSQYRWVVFLIAILSSFRLPRTCLPNDFHGMCIDIYCTCPFLFYSFFLFTLLRFLLFAHRYEFSCMLKTRCIIHTYIGFHFAKYCTCCKSIL